MATFTDRTAVVTGAGSGIGRALAEALARQGARLAVSDVDDAGLAETVRRCEAAGATTKSWHLDVSDRAAVLAHADEVVDALDGVHLVVNNAGVALASDALEHHFDDLDWLLGVNLHGVVNGTQAFLPHLVDAGDGHLVNVSSLFGLVAMPTQSAYNAAKFAVRGYTEAIAMEMSLARTGVRVHAVHPGGIRTDIARNARTSAGRDKAGLVALFEGQLAFHSPEKAARTILRGVARGRRRILVGPEAHAIHLLQQVLGHRYQHVVELAAGRVLRER